MDYYIGGIQMTFINKHWDKMVLGFIIFIFIIAQINSFNTTLSDDGDNALYIILAKSISEGTGYREINDPTMPQHTKFPPLFPIILSPLILLFGINISVLKTFIILLSIITLIVIYLFFKEVTTKQIAMAITAMTAFSFQYFHWSHRIMTEVPIILFIFLTLYFLKKENGWMVALFTLGAIFIKSVGVILLPAIFLYLLFRKEYKQAIIFLLITAVPFGIWTFKSEQNRTYTSQTYIEVLKYKDPDNPELGTVTLTDLVERGTRNAFGYIRSFSQFIYHYNEGIRYNLVWIDIIFMLPILIGVISLLLRKDNLLPFVFIFFMALLLFWPWETIRFVVPILPIIYLFFIEGMIFIFDILGDFDKKYLIYATLILLILIQIPSFLLKMDMDKSFEYDGPFTRYRHMAIWASTNLNETQVTLARKPYLYYIWSDGKKSIRYPYSTDKATWMYYIVQTDYLLYDEISPTTELYVSPIIQELGFLFRPEFYENHTAMFKILNQEANIDEENKG